jgi:hypothetical protein
MVEFFLLPKYFSSRLISSPVSFFTCKPAKRKNLTAYDESRNITTTRAMFSLTTFA